MISETKPRAIIHRPHPLNSPTELKPTTISVIVPSFNRAHYLTGALESLTRQETSDCFTYEVVVVNNASTDNTQALVEEFAQTCDVPVRCLYEEVAGNASSRNRGIRESTGEWLAFFDDDQFAESHWLLNLLSTAQKTNALVVGGPVHLDLDSETIEELSPACRSTLREMLPYQDDCQYEEDVIPGTGNLFVARVLFDRIGLFAPDIREGGSDWKLVNDAREAGYVPWYSSKAGIRHRVEGNRLLPAYFRWDACSGGASQADNDVKQSGTATLLIRCALRAFRSTVWIPALVWSALRPPFYGSSQAAMILWRTEGYLRRSLTILLPRMFPQERFHTWIDFRTRWGVPESEVADSEPSAG